ncbi:MAG: DUF6090 family protein [Cyclobacteriaceae bacterium]
MAKKNRIDFLQIIIEIGVITIGILIAYQLNSWNENRKIKEAEQSILREIRSNLQLDLIDISGNQSGHEKSLQLIDSINFYASGGLYNPVIPAYLFSAFRDFIFVPQTSAFETLKAKGVDLIKNDSLRIRILRLYDFQYSAVIQLEAEYAPGQFYEDFRYIAENYFLSYDINNLRSIRPKFKGANWLSNPDIQIRLDLVRKERSFFNEAYKETLDEVKSLMEAIDKELNQ